MTFSHLKISQQKIQTSYPQGSGFSGKPRRGQDSDRDGKADLRVLEQWFAVPMLSETLGPVFCMGLYTHPSSSTSAAKLWRHDGMGKHIMTVSYPWQCAAQIVCCYYIDLCLADKILASVQHPCK